MLCYQAGVAWFCFGPKQTPMANSRNILEINRQYIRSNMYKAICTKWPVGELRIADRGIREGLLLEMIEKDRQNTAPLENPSSAIPITTTYIRR